FDALPKDLQGIIEQAADQEDKAINPIAEKEIAAATAEWGKQGGTLFPLSPADKASLAKTLGDVGTEVAKQNPQLDAAYKTVTDAARNLKTAAN
ncbi:MAG TPA: hypothetical protein VKV32_05280, partial [Stellaceae bacterium]|nr:hypothetical protein [Stellaceae bacterium]